MRQRHGLPAAAIAAITVMNLAGCAYYAELAYRQDHRLSFTAPQPYELVEEPVTLSWTMKEFEVVEPGSGRPEDSAGYFAIFVDKAPVKPGRTLAEVAGRDEACKRDPKCPDARYLADRGVYTTTKTSFELPAVPALDSNETVQLHEVTVVLLDASGHRIGETAWHVPFKLTKRGIG